MQRNTKAIAVPFDGAYRVAVELPDSCANKVPWQSVVAATCVKCLQDDVTVRYVLADYVPTQRFGGFDSVKAVTIGINPAPNKPRRRALPLLSDFGRSSRSDLQTDDLISISELQTTYFDDGTGHTFFDNNFFFVLDTIDKSWTYQSGRVAHIDVVFCVTSPLWAELGKTDETAQSAIRQNCRPNFLESLQMVPPATWLLWGGSETMKALEELKPVVEASGKTKEKQVAWKMGQIELRGHSYPFMAWDKVVMSNSDRCEIGELVKARILCAAASR